MRRLALYLLAFNAAFNITFISHVFADETIDVSPKSAVEENVPSPEEVAKALEAMQSIHALQDMIKKDIESGNEALKEAATALSNVIEADTPPNLEELKTVIANYRTAKGELSEEETAIIDKAENFMLRVLNPQVEELEEEAKG